LTRVAQLKLIEPDLHHLAGKLWGRAVFGKQGDLRRSRPIFVEYLDATAPRSTLRVVDLSQIQHLTLDHPTIGDASVLHHTPVLIVSKVFVLNYN
jgi:hypothetical protein